MECPSINSQLTSIIEIRVFDKVLSICLSRLIQSKLPWHLALLQIHCKNMLGPVIGIMNLSNIHSVISQIVMNDILLLTKSIEPQYFSIIFQELLLTGHSWIGSNHTFSQRVVEEISLNSFKVVLWLGL